MDTQTWWEVEHYLEEFGEWWPDSDPQYNSSNPRWTSRRMAFLRAEQLGEQTDHMTRIVEVTTTRTIVDIHHINR